MDINGLWQKFDNFPLGQSSAADYVLALLVFIGVAFVLKIFQLIILTRLKKLAARTKTDFDDVVIDIFERIRPPFYFLVALYFGIKMVILPAIVSKVVDVAFIIVVVFEVIRASERIVDYLVKKFLSRAGSGKEEQKHVESVAKTIQVILRVVLWAVGITVALANMGVEVTSLVASLGIGGLAVALALQNVLGDLFSAFSIYTDKPFQVGDFIVVGEHMGTVEQIGLKSTRIRSLGGEQLIISNRELTTARVQNFGRLQKRRVVFTFGVTYETPLEKLKEIPQMVEEIIKAVEGVEFDRCHFKEYGDFSLNFEVVFYVDSPDYVKYMDVRQKINLDLFARFADKGIEFAYPTQTVYLVKGQGNGDL